MSEKLKIDYLKQVLPKPDEQLEEKAVRRQLIEKLKQGIVVEINDELKVTFQLNIDQNEKDDSTIVRILILLNRKQVAAVAAEIFAGEQTAENLNKNYAAKNTPAELKGVGLITFATELLFQALLEMNVQSVSGEINTQNVDSLTTRLQARDVLRGGFFPVESHLVRGVANPQLTRAYMTTHIRSSERVAQPQVFDPQSLQLSTAG